MGHSRQLSRSHSGDWWPGGEQHLQAIWQNLIFGDARLRARVALALSEIVVVSNIAPDQDTDALAFWMDALQERVWQLSHAAARCDPPAASDGLLPQHARQRQGRPGDRAHAEQNYAREVLQLFSVDWCS